MENLRILVRAEKARDVLQKELSALGAIVDEAFAYRTAPETRHRCAGTPAQADLITFTSSSTVENFLAPDFRGRKDTVASIGPITSKLRAIAV